MNSLSDGFVDLADGRYYRIDQCDRIPVFFMNIVSASDLWLFVASNGGLSAGRMSPENSLFPYTTVDRIYDSAGFTGPFTAIWCQTGEGEVLWKPFSKHDEKRWHVTRRLYKSIEGDRVRFEEVNHDLALTFAYQWSTAGGHGFVRRVELDNASAEVRKVRVLDALRNLLPAGVSRRMQNDSSCLVDAYKTAELDEDTKLGIYALASGIVDQPIPIESLRASIVWSSGLDDATVLLSDREISRLLEGERPTGESRSRGVRLCYALSSEIALGAGESRRWMMVGDIGVSQAGVAELKASLRSGGIGSRVIQAVLDDTNRLRALVSSADGFQTGGDEMVTVHHFANVLFNCMRGGVFADGHNVPCPDFARFVGRRNTAAAMRHKVFLDALPDALHVTELERRVTGMSDPDLERLFFEYLPLTFSRRHGDPSRPWNNFNIRIRDDAGSRVLNYEGNWRDIFQNWESLCVSFPAFLGHVVAKFVNASTVDGFNPYRITRDGLDWEVPEEDNPWSTIGYWGDHQVIYLLKLLEGLKNVAPERISSWLRRDVFSYADVPYRIAGYEQMRVNPRLTITFDHAKHADSMKRVASGGTDSRLVCDDRGAVRHVNLTEKLLVVVLGRLVHLVPGGGIWMNTQRPEWNDANNALVGYGLSMVTLCHLRRFLKHFRDDLLAELGPDDVALSESVATLASGVGRMLQRHLPDLARVTSDEVSRRQFVDEIAELGSQYRRIVYCSGLGGRTVLRVQTIKDLVNAALEFCDKSIKANRREDGLFHAYNLLEFVEAPARLRVRNLPAMLEGQVAALSSGVLSPMEVLDTVRALRASALFRADQQSYLLYPDRNFRGFLERNVLPAEGVASSGLLRRMIEEGDTSLVLRDADGFVRFNPDLVNEGVLVDRLSALEADGRHSATVAGERDHVLALYEVVFNHREYTGRSGSMFGYEGLGCIYWHMVSKLLLAVQESLVLAHDSGDPAAGELTEAYYDIRTGLGFNKTAAEFGAFPTDPYSHTPGHSGAQQPGMTGQVKEEILTRLGELGVRIDGGRLRFEPCFLRAIEFLQAPQELVGMKGEQGMVKMEVPAGGLGFTLCGTPVIYRTSGGSPRITVRSPCLEAVTIEGLELDPIRSKAILGRTGTVSAIKVELGSGYPRS